jgi:hypothetical protein
MVDSSIEYLVQTMQLQTKQEQDTYGQPAEGPPGKGEDPPPEFYGPQGELWDMAKPLKSANGREAANPQQHAESLPSIDWMDILLCLATEPQKRDFIVSGYVPAGAAGLLIGTGSTGKSYLALLLCMGIACGRSIPPFDIPKSRGVIMCPLKTTARISTLE